MSLVSIAVFVCVGLVGNASPSPADADGCPAKMTAFPFDIGSKCCTTAAVSGGGVANKILYQHPWAAAIDYEVIKTGASKRLCGGTLISAKYVLTGAHCLFGLVLKNYKPTAVRLGAYDLSQEGKNCLTVEGGEDCNDGAVSFGIEKTIPHPEFSHPNKDIGLIRLKEAAPYTDFIRPICLPTSNLEANPPEHPLYAVGWSNENVKALYKVPFVSLETCKSVYEKFKVVLSTGQLCAGGLEGIDTCRGDGGGPLVYENKEGLSELAGIVSFGSFPCGKKDVPSVYTNIYEYLDWIKSTIVA